MSSYDFERAILHIDGDAFFASCEQATNVCLRNKPIVIGHERGAATAYSYEAKKLGITRGLSMKEISNKFPKTLLVSSNYKKYSLYSNRFKSIVARITDKIEKNSIDECYVDITGLDKIYGISYVALVHNLQQELSMCLGINFSVGLGPTKTTAKIGSSLNKPHGITVITKKYLEERIHSLKIRYVSGIGEKTVVKMNHIGIYTIKEFISKDVHFITQYFSKNYLDLYYELKGVVKSKVHTVQTMPKSISKIHAFKIPTSDPEFLTSEISRHCEVIARKLNRLGLGAKKIRCGYKEGNELVLSKEYTFDTRISHPVTFIKTVTDLSKPLFRLGKKYRATYVVVSGVGIHTIQKELFDTEHTPDTGHKDIILETLTDIETKHGVGILTRASSTKNTRDNESRYSTPLITNSNGTKVLDIIYIGTCK